MGLRDQLSDGPPRGPDRDPRQPRSPLSEGLYRDPAGQVYRVKRSRDDHPYALRLTGDQWGYAPGATRRDLRPLSREEAAEIGHRTSRCAYCGRPLTDPESVRLGIGPYCGDRKIMR